jgi:hypothetical protein
MTIFVAGKGIIVVVCDGELRGVRFTEADNYVYANVAPPEVGKGARVFVNPNFQVITHRVDYSHLLRALQATLAGGKEEFVVVQVVLYGMYQITDFLLRLYFNFLLHIGLFAVDFLLLTFWC